MAGDYIEVVGLRDFQRAARRAVDSELPKRLGQVNKQVGRKFIDQWLHPKPDPAAVGEGAGAKVRPSAAKREVTLRVGGKHRAGHVPYAQWGKRPVRSFRSAPPRPYIKKSVERHYDDIADMWLEAVARAMDPAFHRTEP